MDHEKLEFPLLCHYRIIAHQLPNIDFVIETVLLELGIKNKLKKGNASKGGKYLSFNVDVNVESKETMRAIDDALRSIEGVKMVL